MQFVQISCAVHQSTTWQCYFCGRHPVAK